MDNMNGGDALDTADPAVLKQLIAMGVLDDQGNMINDQVKTAQAMRAAPTTGGGMAGRVYVSQNPLTSIAEGVDKFRATRALGMGIGQKPNASQPDLRAQQQGILDKQTAGREAYLALLKNMRSPSSGTY